MDNRVTEFMRVRNINSIQKLYILLILSQYPELTQTSQQWADRMFIGYLPLAEETLTELQQAALVDCVGCYYQLGDNPQVRSSLQALSETFEDPLTRQELLERVSMYALSGG
ncbi:MAG: hypothetical protein KJ077_25585 [Anaerolineae bacterium]|nr:hypothetical protein [Anaerolineae bacterium]